MYMRVIDGGGPKLIKMGAAGFICLFVHGFHAL